jgi:hypothetical protein
MTADTLLAFLFALAQRGVDLSSVTLNYRFDDDSDVESIAWVGEDLYDPETNRTLRSIVFQSNNWQEEN